MKKRIDLTDIPNISRNELYTFILRALEIIKADRLVDKATGYSYTQARLAELIQLGRKEDISQARNRDSNISTERLRSLLKRLITTFEELRLYTDGSVDTLGDEAEVLLEDLAKKLALNLVDVSTLINKERINYQAIYKDPATYLNRSNIAPPRERFIAVIGAGATHAATKRSQKPIPLASEAMAELRQAFNRKVKKEFIDEEVKRLANLRQTSFENFETQLVALAKFNQNHLLDALTKLCGNRHVPALEHEIIAHLVKHRFLDVVINFNYDELLDNALQEELPNPDDYSFIYSPGQCPKDIKTVMVDKRLKQPIYIKCQGTISYPSSLHFQHDKTLVIEPAIQQHIMDLIMATAPEKKTIDIEETPSNTNKQKLDKNVESDVETTSYMPVNLLFIGFSFKNYVFQKLIEKAAINNPKGIKIWIFDPDLQLPHRVRQVFDKFEPEIRQRCEIHYIPLTDELTLADRLTSLWQKIDRRFRDAYKPRGIDRHTLVCKLFQDTSPLDLTEEELLQYYEDRLLIEIAISILLSDGMLHLSQVPDSRIGKYLTKVQEIQREFPDLSPRSIHHYIEKLGMHRFENFMYDTYQLRDTAFLADIEKLSEHWTRFLYLVFSTYLKGKAVKSRLQELYDKGEFLQNIHGIRHRKLLTIHPRYEHPHLNLFTHLPAHHVFNTSFGWIYNYRKNIETHSDKWDLMLTISEEGRFLKNDFADLCHKGKYFGVVLAANSIKNKPDLTEMWRRNYANNLLNREIRYRPWWMHNKHLVLFVKRNGQAATNPIPNNGDMTPTNWTLHQGFFYRQNLLSRRVTPVKLDKHEDLLKLLYIFAIYWKGASEDRDLSKHISTPLVTSEGILREAIEDIHHHFEQAYTKNATT